MGAAVQVQIDHAVAYVTLSAPKRMNAMSRQMWRDLAEVFRGLNRDANLRCVLVRGEGAHFCAGGDISEYAEFRFQEASLRAFHEQDVWGGLQSMLDCDLPVLAQIAGNCVGAGVEIACCCDIRLAARGSRFGAPIGKLGFPMAPREAALVLREAGVASLRQMLLGASFIEADVLQQRGFLHGVFESDSLDQEVGSVLHRVLSLAPQAARMNKRMLRTLHPLPWETNDSQQRLAELLGDAYAYAESAEHREGVQAFLDKRPAVFGDLPSRLSTAL